MTLEWRFLTNEGQEEEGLGHAGIETFKGSPYPGLARESAQNSLDACLKAEDGSHRPIRMVFRQQLVPRDTIPEVDMLQQTLDACLARSKERGIRKDAVFFDIATSALRERSVSVLTVEDYGTTGLLGPSVAGRPFHALVKGSGVSQKSSADAGGSFGIGKNAAFAVSQLRTVFYSTLYQEGTGLSYLAQGKAILVSHTDARNIEKRGIGYCGLSDFQAVENPQALPTWLHRTEPGTTVASLGFQHEDGWEWQMAESLVRNFFAAVQEGSVTFEVIRERGPSIGITPDTLEALFAHEAIRKAAEETGSISDLSFASAMYQALTSPETKVFEENFGAFGNFRFRLLEGAGLPRRIGFLRNGMYLTDHLRHFTHPLARFSLSRDFIGVVEPLDVATSGRVRDLENPRHDELSADRLDDTKAKALAKTSMRKLGTWLRDVIRAETSTPPEAEMLLDEMNRFFSSPETGKEIQDPSNSQTNPERIKLKTTTSARRRVGSGPDGDSGSAGGQKQKGSKGGKTTGTRAGRGRGLHGGRGGKAISFRGLRSHIPDPASTSFRTISLESDESGLARLEVLLIGAASDEPLDIVTLNSHKCAKTPSIHLNEGERKTVTVEFAESYTGPIRVVLTKVEEAPNAD
ncbi:hypothetical protein [Luteimonas sp. MC1750]|uniref:hypothetical protein n=1 Tax=Luteimonas sp. MC1750 TaxID=2799326 RepID=UPI0018F102D7|nr:hypothetical protein [Luteimonas sp. MC1750]MBJ6984337.1 hypothetical protein [Luteimonas sp. MC1750]QQO05041.1 hypothetical protein JGR68_09140 [Luteimonas sp. MC1750]